MTTNLFKRRPVLAFYVLAFVFSWLGWIPQALHARGMFPFDSPLPNFLGGGGPTLALDGDLHVAVCEHGRQPVLREHLSRHVQHDRIRPA